MRAASIVIVALTSAVPTLALAEPRPAGPVRPEVELILSPAVPATAPMTAPRDAGERAERAIIEGRRHAIDALIAEQAGRAADAAAARARADAAWRLAVAVAQPTLDEAPVRRAHALHLRMYARDRLGDPSAADADALAIIVVCATCPVAASAHVRLGERAFAAADLDAARAHFDAAAALGSAPMMVRGYAHYQLAWVHRNRGDRAATRRHLRRAVAYGGSLGDRGRMLVEVALADAAALAAEP